MNKRAKILILDNGPQHMQQCDSFLASSGYEVINVRDNEAAALAVGQQDVDLVIIDLTSAGAEPLEFCRKLKQMRLNGAIPILLCVSTEDRQVKLGPLRSEIDDIVTLPLDTLELEIRIATLIRLKRLEDDVAIARQQVKSQAQFVESLTGFITHEMNNVVLSIKNSLDLITDKEFIPDALKIDIMAVDDAATELFDLIADFTSINKMERGETKLHLEHTDVNVLVDQAIQQLKLIAKKAAISLINTSFNQVIHFQVDRTVFFRILVDVMISAIKFTIPGGDIGISCELDQQGLRVSVEYTGVEIAPEYHEQIFQKFGHIDIRPVNVKKGSGLSLAFCRLAVAAHEGKIWIENQGKNKGSKFVFTIPKK